MINIASDLRPFWKKIFCLGVIQMLFTISTANYLAAEEAELADDGPKFVLTGLPLSPVKICNQEDCERIGLPKGAQDAIADGYTDAALEDLTGDGIPELILTHADEGSVNSCSAIYRYDSTQSSFVNFEAFSKRICNYTLEAGYIISSYRSGAKWHEEIYAIESGNPVLKVTDSCLGCDYIERTIHLPEDKVEHLLVTNNPNHNQREPLSTIVTSPKAILYKAPSLDQATTMYLVNGDKVILTDFTETESNFFWYKIKYVTAKDKVIQAWISCDKLAICK
ncbi:XAC2610-related protein [Stutzerimonas zhaodongensis]|uniref:XAC2610-related protein n=1 Tax=Stutzerimonas TaxID=2901164 RepID=UPI00388FC475